MHTPEILVFTDYLSKYTNAYINAPREKNWLHSHLIPVRYKQDTTWTWGIVVHRHSTDSTYN